MNFNNPPIETIKGMSSKYYKPEKTFFFERADGTIFSVNEPEAWVIYTGKSQIVGVRTIPPKLIGTSDGKLFNIAVEEAKELFKTLGIDGAQEHIRKGYDAELEEARKHIERPRDFSSVGLNGQPVNINMLR